MAQIDLRNVSIVALDTAPLIYYMEEHPQYLPLVEPVIDAIDAGTITAYTSTVTLLEVLTKPLQEGDQALAGEYREILTSSRLHLISVTPEVAEEAAKLRAKYRLRAPDAIQIATAILNHADLLISNEPRWKRVKEVKLVVLDDLLNKAGRAC